MLNLVKVGKPWFLFWIIFLNFEVFSSNKVIDKRVTPVVFFVDRKDVVTKIKDKLATYKILSLVGVTGIGKTEIARKYAFLNQEKYDLIWFFDASLDLNEQFLSLAQNINSSFLANSEIKIPEIVETVQKDTMNFLTSQNRWLLVFDNLQIEQNKNIKNIIKWDHNGHVIICSQDANGLPHTIHVHNLDENNSLLLLKKILGSEMENDKKLKHLVEIFKGYPAPIVQGAFFLKENNYLSIDEYKNIMTKSSDPIKSHMELLLPLLTPKDKILLNSVALLNNQNFSKKLLQILLDEQDIIGESLYNLSRFGLIKNIENSENINLFEMHDAVKNGALFFLNNEQKKTIVSELINKFNAQMAFGVTSRYAFIMSDPTIKSNLEVLLSNAEKYKVDISLILGLRKNLMDYYVISLDYYNVEKMKDWLEQKEKIEASYFKNMVDNQKINYSWYLTDIGIYEHFAKAKFTSALSYFGRARDLVQNLENIPELKSTILFQTAQAQIYSGNPLGAQKTMDEVEKMFENYKKADFDMGLYWFLKARIALAQMHYNEALTFINNNIEVESHLPRDSFTAPTFIVKAEILNYMAKYQDSYDVISEWEEKEKLLNNTEHELYARILTQLSRAETGLGRFDSGLKYADIACKIFEKDIARYNITSVVNPEYAAALVAKGDALYKNNKFEEALEAYNEGEAIYFRIYGKNYKYMDDFSYLLSQGSKVACLSKNDFWKKHFYDQLISAFGMANERVINTIEFCKTYK